MVPTSLQEIDRAWLATHLGATTIDEIVQVGGDFGFVSTIVRVRGVGDDGPIDVVVKLSDRQRVERETWFFEHVAARRATDGLPALHFSVIEGDRGAIGMDHVDGDQGDVTVAVPDEVIRDLLAQLARFHVHWAGLEDPVLDQVRGVERPRFLLREASIDALVTHRADVVDDRVTAMLRWVADHGRAALDHLDDGPPTLVHGDVHLDNVLLVDGRPVLLDWEQARPGTAAEDVSALIGVLSTEPTHGDVVAARCSTYRAAAVAAGGRVDPELDERVRSALVVLAAGKANWAGEVVAGPAAKGRRWSIGMDAVHEVVRIMDALGPDV